MDYNYYQDLIDERNRLINLIEYARDNGEEIPDTFYNKLEVIDEEIDKLEED